MKKLTRFGVVVVALLLSLSTSYATTISYELEDIADVNAGDDLWQYRYYVSSHVFSVDTGFSVFFDRNTTSQLSPASTHPDWDIQVYQPDLNLPDDGVYDAYALTDGASTTQAFFVDFVRTGSSFSPIQAFEIYDKNFNVLESGNTVARLIPNPGSNPVPEPPVLLLWLAAFVSMGYFRSRKSLKSTDALANKLFATRHCPVRGSAF